MLVRNLDRNSNRLNQKLVIAAMAAMTALPVASRALANNAELDAALVFLANNAAATDPELLADGQSQFAAGNYEQAMTTLQQVKQENLRDEDKAKYTDLWKKVENAVDERKNARASFEKGEAALAQKKYGEASTFYKAAAMNPYADSATKSKAQSQIAVVEAAGGPTEMPAPTPASATGASATGVKDNKTLYSEAVADFKAGKLDEARAKFAVLKEADYVPGLFDRRVGSYLAEINENLAAAPAGGGGGAAGGGAAAGGGGAAGGGAAEVPTPPIPAVDAGKIGSDAYAAGEAAYKVGRYAEAREQFTIARDNNYKAGLFKASPSRYLEMVDEMDAATRPPAVAMADDPTRPAPGMLKAPATQPTQAEIDLNATLAADKIKAAQMAEQARLIVQKAQEAQKDNRTYDAYKLYMEALDADPTNAQARQGAADMYTLVKSASNPNMIESVVESQRIIREVVRYQFDRAIQATQDAIAAKEFTKADDSLNAARVAAESRPDVWPAGEMANFSNTIASEQLTLNRAKEEWARVHGDEVAQNVLAESKSLDEIATMERQRTILGLIKTSKELIHEQEYKKAQGVVNQIISLDPHNDFATGIKQFLNDQVILSYEKEIHERLAREYEKQIDFADERKIPYIDVIVYPDNWPDISDVRAREVRETRQPIGTADQSIAMALEKPIPELRFDGVALADTVDFFRNVTGQNIVVNWKSLAAAGIEKTTPVELRLHGVKFRDALTQTLNQTTGAGGMKPAFVVANGMIQISTSEELSKNTVLQVYDIQDMLIVAPEIPDPTKIAVSPIDPPAGGAGSVFSPGPYAPYPDNSRGAGRGSAGDSIDRVPEGISRASITARRTEQRTQQLAHDIMNLIKTHVDSNSWVDNGGQVGKITFLSGQLAVTQTTEAQGRIVGLLDRLRESQSIMVNIEARFLTIQRNYLEDIGLDIDFFFNINNPQNFSPITINNTTASFTQNPTNPVPGSIAGGQQNSPSIQIQGSYLNDIQVNFLIRATQGASSLVVVTAPRVTVFNGQQASVTVSTQQTYVSNLQAVTGEGVGLYNPVPGTISSGVTLVVQPIVSADRKYVTLAMSPTITQLIALASFPVFGVSTTNNGTGNTQNNVFQGQIQLPLIQVTSVTTIVSVPDGGTLLLGGQTIAGETEKESGVPILSKIPIIKRLFTNKSTAKDEQVVLVLVKPTIIIRREYEEAKFPGIFARNDNDTRPGN